MDSFRPTWDEHFMKLAKVSSERSNCIRRKVGSIIVKNNRIISMGFNGTPSGITNCYEGGCTRCNDPSIKSGDRLSECICRGQFIDPSLDYGVKSCYSSLLHIGCGGIRCRRSRICVTARARSFNRKGDPI